MIEEIAEYINANIAYYYRMYVNNPSKFVPDGVSKDQAISGGAFKIPLQEGQEVNIEHLKSLVPHASEIKITDKNIEVYFIWPKKEFNEETTRG